MGYRRSPLVLALLVMGAMIGRAAPIVDPPPPAQASPPALVAAPPATRTIETTLRAGETLESVLVRNGLERPDAVAAVGSLAGLNMRRLRTGARVAITGAPDSPPSEIAYWHSPADCYELRRASGQWMVRHVLTPLDTRVVAVIGEVRDSLFASMERLGQSAALTARLVSLFEWDFDFAADSLRGDRFRFLVEKRYAGDRFVADGNILIAQYVTAGRPVLTSVTYRDADGESAYYDDRGRSTRKMFLRAPLDFTWITSGFSHGRHHPILGGLRPHLAIDYGAPIGTPVRAVADGVVAAAGWAGGYGLSVTLRHPRGYGTMYNHLARLDVRPGETVRQRQVIGRVGSTGLSTGPHLDYRVTRNGVFVNPLGEKFIPGAPIPPARWDAFRAHVHSLVERLDRAAPLATSAAERG